MRKVFFVAAAFLLGVLPARGQSKLSVKWEELTAEDFRQAIQQSKGTCLLPFGILEKHGPHLPLGTDLLNVRYASLHAAEQEFAVVFPEYYFGQIFEAKHEPGTIAYSMELQLKLLQETTDEMARNGCKKVIIVNGHGGNEHLLPYFAQAQMASPKDYVVYVLDGERSRPGGPGKKSTGVDYHAGEMKLRTRCIHTLNSRTSIALAANSAPTRSGRTCRIFSTRESGGTRASRIIIRVTAPWRQKSWASGTCRAGFPRSWKLFAPSKRTTPA
ncbi:MAG TPA: creatininase family protein [Candidatus Acidoferrum sp.]|nr:creatininase family protein [Candidatus Acidoferrum sp.]